jgi:hypothetical protein
VLVIGYICGVGWWKRDVLEDKVIRVSWRWCEHDDDGDNPVLEEAHEWGVEGLVAGPEAGEREKAFAADFLDNFILHVSSILEEGGGLGVTHVDLVRK